MKITINSDDKEVERIRRAVMENDGFCPCKMEHLERNRCICLDFIEQDVQGWCHCGLYYKSEV